MAFGTTSPYAAAVPIGGIDLGVIPPNGGSTLIPQVPLGTIIEAVDPVYGFGRFIYLKGVASTVLGSCVTWGGIASSAPTWQTALCASTAGLNQKVAFATAAIVANQYGWYQISGCAICATNGTLAAGPAAVYISATPGQLTSTQANGKQILGAVNCSATGTPAANQALVYIDNCQVQGQIV